jgi:hypothetical protein
MNLYPATGDGRAIPAIFPAVHVLRTAIIDRVNRWDI